MVKKSKKIIFWIVAIGLVFLSYAHFETYWIKVTHTNVASRYLPAEFAEKKIVYVADIHCGEGFAVRKLDNLIKKINFLKPDILLLGGDYVDRGGKFTAACFKKMAEISAPLGKFGVMGNHDIEAGAEKIKKVMVDAGIEPLVNDNRKISINESEITIAGVDETWYGKPDGAKAMKGASDFTVYLSHDPWYLEQYPPNAPLLLAGHTHGGQVTLFGIPFAGLAHGRNYKYEKGIFNEPGRTIIVTNGIGATILPLRFFARPEINLITLKKSN